MSRIKGQQSELKPEFLAINLTIFSKFNQDRRLTTDGEPEKAPEVIEQVSRATIDT